MSATWSGPGFTDQLIKARVQGFVFRVFRFDLGWKEDLYFPDFL